MRRAWDGCYTGQDSQEQVIFRQAILANATSFSADRLSAFIDRRGPQLATVVLLLLLAWLMARAIWLFATPREVVVPPGEAPAIDARQAANRIASAHLFGVAGEAGPAETAQVSNLNLKLKGVFAYTRDSPAYAIVNTGQQRDESFRVGEQITPGVALHAVHPTHILIKRAGQVERVNLEERPGAGGAPAARQPQFRLNVPQTAPGSFSLSKSELTTSLNDPKQFANLGRLNVSPGGGVIVEEVPPGSLADKLGLQVGDIIKTVNGTAISTPLDLSRLYPQLQTGIVRVEGNRGNRQLNLTYSIQQ